MTNAPQRYCKKCLLREMEEGEYFKNLYDYIQRLPADDKVPEEIYDERLNICKECDNLQNGMCRICGCYVELRAAMKVRACPGLPARWIKFS